MRVFLFINKDDVCTRIMNGSLQESIMDYLKKSEEMELPVSEDTLLYSFEAEFEVEIAEGDSYISDEEIAHKKGEIASKLHDVILLVWERYQKELRERLPVRNTIWSRDAAHDDIIERDDNLPYRYDRKDRLMRTEYGKSPDPSLSNTDRFA